MSIDIDQIESVIEKFLKTMVSVNRGTFVLCTDRLQQHIVVNILHRKIKESGFLITSRESNEWQIDYKSGKPDADYYDCNIFLVTNEEEPGEVDSFAARYILQMPMVTDAFASEKLKKCKIRMPDEWSCEIL